MRLGLDTAAGGLLDQRKQAAGSVLDQLSDASSSRGVCAGYSLGTIGTRDLRGRQRLEQVGRRRGPAAGTRCRAEAFGGLPL